ncbi:BnaA05g36830D [Brassica napus]|uniref:BnaA05g36830D protein n=1 Tax=Brassica napus TaxID=3708 RepID=A0A078IP08_BRANA|nr:BnaA05g36830D [Brassica napus]
MVRKSKGQELVFSKKLVSFARFVVLKLLLLYFRLAKKFFLLVIQMLNV